MISKNMVEALNRQIGVEFFSSNIYLQMSSWAENQGLENCAAFFRKHAEEEQMHMHKIFDYICEKGELAIIGQINEPPRDYVSIHSVFEQAYKHEQFVTKSINDLVSTAYEEKDWATFNFLQWFVEEQVEEEGLFQKVLDKVKLIGDNSDSLYFIDQEVGNISAASAAA
ncbi:MAG: ferritin [Gammaproteobacteria bacterium]|nr:MAG: ferritin [Gammaproteobacteria bacterium]